MAQTDKRVDAYIEKAKDFARPILLYIRSAVHKGCPEVTETIKWGFPNFEYEGKILCSMASFREHCAFMFRLAPLMKDPHGYMAGDKTGMGHFGQIRSLRDLPKEKVLVQYIMEAMELTGKGAKLPKAKTSATRKLDVPADFIKELRKNKAARSTFENFSYSHRKEYVEWITEAKTEETRRKRMATALEWLGEGKARNWKYMKP